METNEEVEASANSERKLSIAHLTKIDGIAGKTAEALYEIGIRGYADLLQYSSQRSAQQVSVALKEQGVSRPPAFIDLAAWAGQARRFSKLEDAALAPPEAQRELEAKPEEMPSSHDLREHDAVFTVSLDVATDGDREPALRTTVCDRSNGGQEAVFEGNDTAPWVNWILEQAHLPVAVERIAAQDDAISSPVPVEPGDTRLAIGDIQVSVIGPNADGPERRLKAEFSLELSGSDAESLASRRIPFRIEAYTLDTVSGVSELVASEESQLVPRVFKYVGQQEFGIPDVGHYELHTIVLLLPPGSTATYHCGPTIRVVP